MHSLVAMMLTNLEVPLAGVEHAGWEWCFSRQLGDNHLHMISNCVTLRHSAKQQYMHRSGLQHHLGGVKTSQPLLPDVRSEQLEYTRADIVEE